MINNGDAKLRQMLSIFGDRKRNKNLEKGSGDMTLQEFVQLLVACNKERLHAIREAVQELPDGERVSLGKEQEFPQLLPKSHGQK